MARAKAAKDGHTLGENVHTQPLVRHPVFGNPEVLTEGWYPACPSSALRARPRSVRIGAQRIVLWRGEDGRARALDAFCPHMGADLGNGRVVGNELECYFHQWRFGCDGRLTCVPVQDAPPRGVGLLAYPVSEKYGHVWVFSAPGAEAPYPVPCPPGLEDAEVSAFRLGEVTLYAHHHVMMAGGIDLQHFHTVHQLPVDFSFEVEERGPGVVDWKLEGSLPATGWRTRLGRAILGERIGYAVRIGGASVAAITYGPNQRFRGRGAKLPPLHIVWGCLPLESGVSRVTIFLCTRKRAGVFGRLKSAALLAGTAALLAVLQDDDVKAFPNMRFNPAHLIGADKSVGRFIHWVDSLPLSRWSRALPAANEHAGRPLRLLVKS